MKKVLEFFNDFPFISFLKGQWILFWNWIKLAHSSSDEASSKRLYGGLSILTCITTLVLVMAGKFPKEVWTVAAPYWTFLLVIGVALLSLSTYQTIITSLKDLKIKSVLGDEPKVGE